MSANKFKQLFRTHFTRNKTGLPSFNIPEIRLSD